eukprot:289047-Heterocapsa_arctica.AAC.1
MRSPKWLVTRASSVRWYTPRLADGSRPCPAELLSGRPPQPHLPWPEWPSPLGRLPPCRFRPGSARPS